MNDQPTPCLSNFLANQERVAPHIRPKALWEHTADFRTGDFWDTPEGEDLMEAVMWRLISEQELNKRGMRLKRPDE